MADEAGGEVTRPAFALLRVLGQLRAELLREREKTLGCNEAAKVGQTSARIRPGIKRNANDRLPLLREALQRRKASAA